MYFFPIFSSSISGVSLFQCCDRIHSICHTMGVKASSLMWCEYNTSCSDFLAPQDKPAKYFYCYKVPPPSYNHNWTDLHYAASHGNVRRINEIIHKNGRLTANDIFNCQYGVNLIYIDMAQFLPNLILQKKV